MSNFDKVLRDFEEKLRVLNPNVINSMNIGINKKYDIENIFKNKYLNLTDDLICFYQWKNGFDESNIALDGKMLLMPNGFFLKLDIMINIYESITNNESIGKSFFPLSYQDMYLVDLDKNSTTYEHIFFYSSGFLILKPVTIFDSLVDMFLTINICFDEKALWYNDEGYLETDWDLYNEICKKNNPHSEYWNFNFFPFINT